MYYMMVKQGDNLSPTLFNLFINNLAIQIKALRCSIKIGIEQVSILCILNYMMHVLFQQCCMVPKYLDIIINPSNLEKHTKKEH